MPLTVPLVSSDAVSLSAREISFADGARNKSSSPPHETRNTADSKTAKSLAFFIIQTSR